MIGLHGMDADAWDSYKKRLKLSGSSYRNDGDKIIWSGSPMDGSIQVKELYLHILKLRQTDHYVSPFHQVWKWHIPTKILLLVWLLWKRKILT